MTYTFDWKDVVHGQIEIEAENGVEAERLFREMPLEQRLAASNVGVDKDTLDIKFVDVGFGDIQTPEEWALPVIGIHLIALMGNRIWHSRSFFQLSTY
jgi:hypothetical protein